jgi:hypothetical protein
MPSPSQDVSDIPAAWEGNDGRKPEKQVFITALKHIKMMDPAAKQI